jgi:hypothetical protein
MDAIKTPSGDGGEANIPGGESQEIYVINLRLRHLKLFLLIALEYSGQNIFLNACYYSYFLWFPVLRYMPWLSTRLPVALTDGKHRGRLVTIRFSRSWVSSRGQLTKIHGFPHSLQGNARGGTTFFHILPISSIT